MSILSVLILVTQQFVILRITFYGIIFINYILAPFLIYFIITDIKAGNSESTFILAGAALGFICLNCDVLAGFNIKICHVPEFIWTFSPFGIVFLLISLSLSIDKRFSVLKNKQNFVKEMRKKQKEVYIEKINTEELNKNLTTLMETEKIYYDDTLTLAGLAARLSVPPHILTEFLNKKLKLNFNSFINKYRIKEARHLLIEDRGNTVISIAYKVGFNTISKFYEAFKKFTGETPKEFRKRHSGK